MAEEEAVAEALETHELEKKVHEHSTSRTLTLNVWWTITANDPPTRELRPTETFICKCGAWRYAHKSRWTPSNYPSSAQIAVDARRRAKEAEATE